MKMRHVVFNCDTQQHEEWFEEISDEAYAAEVAAAKAYEAEEFNEGVKQELAAHAIASFDDMISGDPQKLKALRDQRDAIRAKLK